MKTKLIFCANDQSEEKHVITIDGNGEFVCTCEKCGRFLKFAANTKEELLGQLETHKTANEGQLTVDALQKKLDEMIPDDKKEEKAKEEPVTA